MLLIIGSESYRYRRFFRQTLRLAFFAFRIGGTRIAGRIVERNLSWQNGLVWPSALSEKL
jgi:hypothetical protein